MNVEALTERIRKICLSFPDTSEKLSHGAPTWFARGRTFVMFLDNHHGDGRTAIWCNAPPGAQAALVNSDPKTFFVPPYVGPKGWLGIRLDRPRPRWREVTALIEQAYRITGVKKKAIL